MPVYDYECGKCSHKFEARRSFSEGASAICPACKSEAERVFSPVPIVFKGSGFYVTDYRKEKAPVEEKAPAPVASKETCTTPGSCCKTGTECCKN
jgi:putative FmdB family regulatory protein